MSPVIAQPRQRGMAIVSALLIAALVAVLAGSMLSQQSLFTRQLENQQRRAEGAAVLQAGLDWSRQLLAEQRKADPLVRRDQRWAQPLGALPVGERGGQFQGTLEDEQGKFNLRNLVYEDQPDPRAEASLRRLFELLELRPALATAVTTRVIDGYPLRSQVAPDQAFDSGRGTSPGAQTQLLLPRQPMLRDVRQLAEVPGMDEASLQRLLPFVTLLPTNTWVNGNTAPAEVLAAQVPGLSLQKAHGLVAEREGGHWFVNRGDFVNRLHMPHLVLESVEVGITSDWFRLHGQTLPTASAVHVGALLHVGEAGLPRVIWTRVGA
ncbi:type II secretion system minor pseudopilin GspK [Pseudomonas sp. UFMG81]|uniref:type II secretion system minor pseudopilin GspK n=1 Tax=Pseudomonas sp. UFMG81 TaxID=2745936 RepID=UPI001E3981D5|nr:type II secretion system minor pseudopilin GspK [Pseudomonas sp. UFMG81]